MQRQASGIRTLLGISKNQTNAAPGDYKRQRETCHIGKIPPAFDALQAAGLSESRRLLPTL